MLTTSKPMQKYTIDAKGKAPGRVATEVAVILMGKNRTDFARNTIPDVEIEVTNAGGLRLDQKRIKDKKYYAYSGYPGGLKTTAQGVLVAKKGVGEVLRRAVYGMLPKNKLRPRMMKNLKIND